MYGRCITHHFEGFSTALSVLFGGEGDVDGSEKRLEDDFARSLTGVPTDRTHNNTVCSLVTVRLQSDVVAPVTIDQRSETGGLLR